MKIKNKIISLERAYDIIKKPITTEKSTNLQQFNQYTFAVLKNSALSYINEPNTDIINVSIMITPN